MKITIVGAGIMGLSTAWAATRAGHEVTVLEQGAIPNEDGSSTDETRLIRHAYGALHGYAALVDPAYAAWDRLWDALGTRHYRETGTLCLTASENAWFTASVESLEKLGQPIELLDEDALARRFPALAPGPGSRGFHVPTGGILMARAILRDTAKWLARHGAVLRTDAHVSAIDPATATCSLAEGGTVEADRLVVAAGPWTPSLVSGPVDVTASRQVAVFAEIPSVHARAWAEMPMLLDIGEDAGTYIVPPARDGLLKIGTHRFSRSGDPDDDRVVPRDQAEAVLADCSSWLRAPELYRLSSARACYYTLAPEERFIVRQLASATWVMAGFSGHGFKFGPLLGEQVVSAIDGACEAKAVTALAAGAMQAGSGQ